MTIFISHLLRRNKVLYSDQPCSDIHFILAGQMRLPPYTTVPGTYVPRILKIGYCIDLQQTVLVSYALPDSVYGTQRTTGCRVHERWLVQDH